MKHLLLTSLSLSLLLLLSGCSNTDNSSSDGNATVITDTSTTGSGGDTDSTDTTTETSGSSTEQGTAGYSVVKRIKDIGDVTTLTQKGNRLYLGTSKGKLLIYDVSDATDPHPLSTVETNDTIEDIAIEGSSIYLANNQEGLVVVDGGDIRNPVISKKLSAGYARSVAVANGNVYVAGGHRGISVFDTATLAETAVITVEGDYTDSIAVKDNLAFTSDAYNSYSVVTDLTTQDKVVQLEKENSFYEARDDFAFSQDKNTLFIADGVSGFDIFNISDIKAPFKYVHMDAVDNQSLITHITLSNNQRYAYVDDLNQGVLVYDITNIYTPKLLTIADLNETQSDAKGGRDSDISEDGQYLFVTRANDGFLVLALSGDDTALPNSTTDYLNLDKWDIYGTAKNVDNQLFLGDSNGKDVNDMFDGDGNLWNKLADGSTQYDYDAVVSKADFTPPLTIMLQGKLHGSAFGYNNIGIAPKAENFTNVIGEGLPIENDIAVFSLNWEKQNILRLYVQGYGYIDTSINFSIDLTGEFQIRWDGKKVSFYYNGTLLSENDLIYDTSKTYKVYMKNYESDFEISRMTIE